MSLVKMRSHWSSVSLTSIMIGVLTRRGETDADRRTGRKPRKKGAELGGMYLLAKGHQGFLTTARSGRGQEGSPI